MREASSLPWGGAGKESGDRSGVWNVARPSRGARRTIDGPDSPTSVVTDGVVCRPRIATFRRERMGGARVGAGRSGWLAAQGSDTG